MTHVELFTGARAVDADEFSQRWSRAIVRDVIASLPPDALVIVGDAPGVDRIVRSEVMLAGRSAEEYATLDGFGDEPSTRWHERPSAADMEGAR